MFNLLLIAVIIWLISYWLKKTKVQNFSSWPVRLLKGSSFILVLVAVLGWWATPNIILPAPTGAYTVAVSHWTLKTERPETYTLNPSDKRKLHLKIWYPTADLSNSEITYYKPVPTMANYASPNMAKHLAAVIGSVGPLSFLAPYLEENINAAKLSAYAGSAPLASAGQKFPILLFSPGHRAHLDFFSITMQDIASHGYIVVGVNHSYETGYSVLPTGEHLIRTDTALETTPARSAADYHAIEQKLNQNYALIDRLGLGSLNETQEEEFALAYNKIIKTPQSLTTDLPLRVQDLISTISFLEKSAETNKKSALFTLMDFSNVGAFGMSFGGPTSAEFCRIYGKCKAIANLDGKNWGKMLEEPLDVPMMWVKGSYTLNTRFDVPYTLKRWRGDAYRVVVPGALHQSFTDAPFLSPLVSMAVLEFPYNLNQSYRETVHHLTNSALVAFFNHYTKGGPLDFSALHKIDTDEKIQIEEFKQGKLTSTR
jgi:predicted dienelactone hydrolase